MRVPQNEGTRGSLKLMQLLSARMPHSIGSRLKAAVGLRESDHIDWLSPAPGDRAEFRDSDFLELIGEPRLVDRMKRFWPQNGPQWDGVARCGDTVILVEAKAHAPEMSSTCAAGPESMAKIRAALTATQVMLGVNPSADWTKGYYQYANRIAHTEFLRLHGVNAQLVFIYFFNADMGGPSTAEGWAPAIKAAHSALGLDATNFPPGVHDLFIDAQEVTQE